MRVAVAFALLLVASQSLAAPAPRRREGAVRRIILPAGAVKCENVKTPGGVVVRVTAGKVVVEGKRLFLGDGKVAMVIEATDQGMRFVHAWGMQGESESTGTIGGGKFFVIDGTHTDQPGAAWLLEPDCPTADKLEAGSVYLVTPSIHFKRQARTTFQGRSGATRTSSVSSP